MAGLGLFCIYLATATFDLHQNIDSLSTMVPAWQLASHGNVYTDQYAGFTPWFIDLGDHVVSNRLPGAILWATPFYVVLGRGGLVAPLYPAAVASAAAAALAAVFLFLALRTLVRQRLALGATAIFALSIPTWSVSADALWSHGPAQMCLTLSLLLYSRKRLALAGLAQAVAIVTRPHLAAVSLVMGVWQARAQRSFKTLLVLGATSSLGVLGLLIYFRLAYGMWTLSGGYGSLGGYGVATSTGQLNGYGIGGRLNGFSRIVPNLAGALVSPGRGLVIYSPFLLLLLPGVRGAWTTAPVWVRSASIGGLAYLAIQLWNNSFTGGRDLFAYRLMLETLTLCVPLLVLSYNIWTVQRVWRLRAFAALALFSGLWQASAAIGHTAFPRNFDVWRDTGYSVVLDQHAFRVVTLAAIAVAAYVIALCRSRWISTSSEDQPSNSQDRWIDVS